MVALDAIDHHRLSYSTSADGSVDVVRELKGDYYAGLGVVVVRIFALALVLVVGWSLAAMFSGDDPLQRLALATLPALGIALGIVVTLLAKAGKLYDCERVTVSRWGLVRRRRNSFLDSSRTFEAPEISALRWEPSSDESPSSVAFFYDFRTVRIFKAIKKAEGTKFIGTVTEQIPAAVKRHSIWRARSQDA